MTLNTRVHIADPVNPEGLFLHLFDVLVSDPAFVPAWENTNPSPWNVDPGPIRRGRGSYEHTRKGEQVYQRRTGKPLWIQSESEYQSTIGQGLAAILEVRYAQDAPIRWIDEPELDGSEGPLNEHLVSVSFDTSYGYRDANGAGCGDLHAFLLREVRDYLVSVHTRLERPIRAVWMHEEDGTWHLLDDYAHRGNPDLSVLNAARIQAALR